MNKGAWSKRGAGRFEVRSITPAPSGPPTRLVMLRTSKVELGLIALADVARQWANAHGAVVAGTVVDLIDTTDGGPLAQLKYLGFESGTLDDALNTLRVNGFTNITEVTSGTDQDAGNRVTDSRH